MEAVFSSDNSPTVFVVDDDPKSRDSLGTLMESVGLPVKVFESAVEFLDSYEKRCSGCLVLDVRLPEMDGLQLQRDLQEKKVHIPVILITGYAEIEMAVQAMKDGAFDFMEKPFSPQQLLTRVQSALAVDALYRDEERKKSQVLSQLRSLSKRERQVMDFIIEGKTTKEIAADVHISETTVDFHRRNLLEKMDVDNIVKLVRKLNHVELSPEPQTN